MQMGMTDCGPGRDRPAPRPTSSRAPVSEQPDRSPAIRQQHAVLTVAPPQEWPAADAERLDDLLHRCGGHLSEVEPSGSGSAAALLDMVFESVEEAVAAAITLRRVEDDRWQHLRVAVMTAVGEALASPVAGVTRTWAHRLVRHAAAGQTLVTSAVAVRSAGGLLPGLDLVSRGTWRPTVSEQPDRIYELVEVAPSSRRGGGSNLGWAIAALQGHETHPGDRDVLDQTLRVWGSGALSGTVTILGGPSPTSRRCAAELALAAHSAGSTVLYGAWTEDHADRYGVYREAFGRYAARCDDRQLIADLEGHARELARLLPEVGAAVGGAHLVLGGQPDLARLCDCLETWLTKMAQRSPVLLVLDQAELMTAASQLVLIQLAHSLSGTPVRFLLADHGPATPTRRVQRLTEHLGRGLCAQLTVA